MTEKLSTLTRLELAHKKICRIEDLLNNDDAQSHSKAKLIFDELLSFLEKNRDYSTQYPGLDEAYIQCLKINQCDSEKNWLPILYDAKIDINQDIYSLKNK